MSEQSNTLFRQWQGPLTEELLLHPGDFGLGKVPARLKPDATTRSVCGFCSTGCSLDIHLKDGVAVNLSPSSGYPVNLGMACPKGWEALTPLYATDRAKTPLIRDERGELQPASWDDAMKLFTSRFKGIMAEHGNESVAFLSTGQICTEEMAFLGTLYKFGMGGLHCDSNTRQCMATSHVAYKQSFGFDAPPYTYADFEESDVLFFIGSNLCIAHPIMWQRVLLNKKKPEIIVIDPRRTETAAAATQHLALQPKSDLTLLYGLANLLIQNHWIKLAYITHHTTGFHDFAEFVRQFTPDKVAAETGLTVGQLYHCAETIAKGKAVSFWWTMGVNQSHEATRTAQAIINLALMTGNMGRPGTGANSVTGQCNAMGSRLYANVTGLPGGRDFMKAEDRADIARLLSIPEERIPQKNSWAYDQIIDGIEQGKIKGLWVIATNTAHSWVNQKEFREIARKLDFLVVQDMYATTETIENAHLVLPAAGWGEKEGTFINSERRIGLVKKVSLAPGQALSDFNIFRLIAHYWGCEELFKEWSSPEAAFQILKRFSAGRPCDITGVRDYAHLDESGGIQWPFVQGAKLEVRGANEAAGASPLAFQTSHLAERRLFEDGKYFTPDGRAKFLYEAPRPVTEPTSVEYPFVLLTGRGTSAQWHTQTRTGKSAVLKTLYPANAYVEINPQDAARLGIKPNSMVSVSSRRARIQCTAFITTSVQACQAFIPMHYGVTNKLTKADFDPYSRQPSYKHCAVRIEPVGGSESAVTSSPTLKQAVAV
ncbi:MAG TPA: nitrate reductase [Verrucomicrobiae bacterium]